MNLFNINAKNRAEDDEDSVSSLLGGSSSMVKSVSSTTTTHIVHIDSEIGDPSDYREVINLLLTAGPNDNVAFCVNSHGGRVDTIHSIVEAMNASKANIAVNVVGCAYSAASMLACLAPMCFIGESAEFMLHTARYGSIGTVPNVKDMADFSTKQLNKMLDKCYSGFLTEKELVQLKAGKEFWFDSSEARTRMEKRYKFLEAQDKALEKALAEPKKVAKKTPAKKVTAKKAAPKKDKFPTEKPAGGA